MHIKVHMPSLQFLAGLINAACSGHGRAGKLELHLPVPMATLEGPKDVVLHVHEASLPAAW